MQILVFIMEGAMPPIERSPIFVQKTKKNYIEVKDIRTKFKGFNCSGVLDMQIL